MTAPRIVATPGTCFGQPRLDGTRVTIGCIRDRFLGGDSVTSIADDLGLDRFDVETALRFALWSPGRRKRYLAGEGKP